MEDNKYRNLPVKKGRVSCLPLKDEGLDKCRFCVHSVYFITNKGKIPSPARAFCNLSRSTEEVDLKNVSDVICDDMYEEGFRSIMNIIS